MALFPLRLLFHIQLHNAAMWLPHTGKYLKLHPLPRNKPAKTKKYGPNEQMKAPEKIQLSDEERASPAGAEFKTLIGCSQNGLSLVSK